MRETDVSIYDRAAQDWWSGQLRWLRVLQGLVPVRLGLFDGVVGDWSGKDVLDLGCGGGFMAEAMARRGARVTGVDPSRQAIAAARAHATVSGLAIDYRVGLGEAIPADDATCDAVVCVDVLEHVSDLHQVAREIARVLRPGGLLLFDTINRTALARFAIVTLGERILRLLPPGTHEPAQFIRPDELRLALAQAGLAMGPVVGLGPRSVTRGMDVGFGRVPTTAVLYAGHARREGRG
jgi:2-polyprenyl-6-hydroxyphenyl methylase/3-demethylubiquinone-9 3-methyltransferase